MRSDEKGWWLISIMQWFTRKCFTIMGEWLGSLSHKTNHCLPHKTMASLSKSTSIGFSAFVNIIQGSILFPSGTNSLWIITFLHKKNYQHVSDLYSNYVWKKSLQTVTMRLLFIHETMWEGMDIMLIFSQSSWQTWQTVSWLKCSSSSINLRAIQWSLVQNSLTFATVSGFQAVDRHPFLESSSMFSHIPI